MKYFYWNFFIFLSSDPRHGWVVIVNYYYYYIEQFNRIILIEMACLFGSCLCGYAIRMVCIQYGRYWRVCEQSVDWADQKLSPCGDTPNWSFAWCTDLVNGVIIRNFLHKLLNFPFRNDIFFPFLWFSGAAGRHFNQTTGLWIPRITGLDPANPCFNNGQVLSGLFRGDAAFVDVIHSNPGCLGKKGAIGDADFFCNGIVPLQPGCFTVSCAHSRSWKYYAETVYPGNEYNFLARACTSLIALDSKYCIGPLIPMGYAALVYVKGNFFLRTKSKNPYGEYSRTYYVPVCVN